MTMLDHQKLMLKNVSFNEHLFIKELYKSTQWLSDEELDKLHNWVYTNYGQKFSNILRKTFQTEAA